MVKLKLIKKKKKKKPTTTTSPRGGWGWEVNDIKTTINF